MNLGAQLGAGGVTYRVWAPGHRRIRVRIRRHQGTIQSALHLEPVAGGYFVGSDPDGREGDRYFYELSDGNVAPDPASRFQPEGVHGPSECVDPRRYRWRTEGWRRPAWRRHVVYELHIGAFTPAGTFLAAIERLGHIRELGATAIEIMPVADFPGERNWGYDGVALYAPARCYGRPDDLRALVDAAHAHGLAVILDVVYNHFGPDGNALPKFSPSYFHPAHRTPWGKGFNFDGGESGPVRDFFVGNAAYWLDEFRIDGLRLDATHALRDDSPRHILAEIAEAVHARGGFVTAEDDRNAARLLRGGLGLDAVWSDDFHHEVRVALTGIRQGYFGSYEGSAAEIARTIEDGWTYSGQPFPFWQGRPRGSPGRELPVDAFIACIENHDQIGNRAGGERLEHLVAETSFRAASLLLCLLPYPPLLFMGQEWSAGAPFQYFTDHAGELGRAVSEGRRREFPDQHNGDGVPDPQDPRTFIRSKLDWTELGEPGHAAVFALYRACLRERKAWLDRASDRRFWKARAFGEVVAIRYHPPGAEERLVLAALRPGPPPPWGTDPFLRPPPDRKWELTMHSGRAGPPYPMIDFSIPAAALFTAVPR